MHVRRILVAALAVGAMFTVAACAGDDLGSGDTGSKDKGSLTLSGQKFPEATLVAEMYRQVLENAGYSVTVKLTDTRDVYMKQFPGSIDVVPEYIAGIGDFLNITKNGPKANSLTTNDAQESLSAIEPLAKDAGITLLDPSEATDQNAFFVTKKFADDNSLTTLSDLAAMGQPVKLAAAPDCQGRSDCEGGLSSTYGIDISQLLPLGYASPQTYDSVLKGEAVLGETSTTDGSLASQGLVILEDDKGIQPAQNLVPAVSSDFLDANPDVADVLNKLMSTLTTDDLTTLNGKVGTDREKPEDVAKTYLSDKGLL